MVMDLIAKVQSHDVIIFLGSDKRSQLMEAIFDKDIITVNIGHSPLTEDVYVDPKVIKDILDSLRG
jgi:thiamine pyrophosphate-dependent acetolactate synthase large subunit-like protein